MRKLTARKFHVNVFLAGQFDARKASYNLGKFLTLWEILKSAEKAVRVLVIEDNPDDRELLLYQLRKSGMDSHVKFISDGREALDFLTNPRASDLAREVIAVFLDLRLPSLSGLDLLRRLRAHDHLQALPVIVMTSSNDPKDMEGMPSA